MLKQQILSDKIQKINKSLPNELIVEIFKTITTKTYLNKKNNYKKALELWSKYAKKFLCTSVIICKVAEKTFQKGKIKIINIIKKMLYAGMQTLTFAFDEQTDPNEFKLSELLLDSKDYNCFTAANPFVKPSSTVFKLGYLEIFVNDLNNFRMLGLDGVNFTTLLAFDKDRFIIQHTRGNKIKEIKLKDPSFAYSFNLGVGVVFPPDDVDIFGNPFVFYTFNGLLFGKLIPIRFSDVELFAKMSVKGTNVNIFEPNFGTKRFSFGGVIYDFSTYKDDDWRKL